MTRILGVIYNVRVSNGTAHAVAINVHFKAVKGLILHLNILRESSIFAGGSKMVQSSHKKRLYQSTRTQWHFHWADLASTPLRENLEPISDKLAKFNCNTQSFSIKTTKQSAGTQTNFLCRELESDLKVPTAAALTHAISANTWPKHLAQEHLSHLVWETKTRFLGLQVSEKEVYFLTQGRSPLALPWKERYVCK